MAPEGSLPQSQKPHYLSYPKPDKSIVCVPIQITEDSFNIAPPI